MGKGWVRLGENTGLPTNGALGEVILLLVWLIVCFLRYWWGNGLSVLVSVFDVVAAAAPDPLLVERFGPVGPRAAARRQLALAAGARHRMDDAGRGDGVRETRLATPLKKKKPVRRPKQTNKQTNKGTNDECCVDCLITGADCRPDIVCGWSDPRFRVVEAKTLSLGTKE